MKSSDRQQEILQAAGSILTEGGLEQLTIKKLAIRVGVAESALYRHFSGKEEILFSLLQKLSGHLEALVATIQHEPVDTPLEKIQLLLNRHLEFLASHPHFLVAVFSEGLHEYSDTIRSSIIRIMSMMKEVLTQFMVEARDSGQVRDDVPPILLAQMLMGSIRLLLLEWRISRFDYDILPKGHQQIAYLLLLITLKPIK